MIRRRGDGFPGLVLKMKNSQFFVSVFKVGSGQLIGQLLSVVTVPILSRVYSEMAYGDTALITSTAALIYSFSLFGLSTAIMNAEDEQDAKRVFATVFLLNLIISFAVVFCCMMLRNRYKLFTISEDYETALMMMWGYIILSSTDGILRVYTNRQKKYNKLFLNPIIGALSQFLIAVPLGYAGFGYKGFMIAHIMHYGATCLHMAWNNSPFPRKYGITDFKRTLFRYRKYVFYQYPSEIINNFGIEYPTQFLGRCFTSQQLGGYSMCTRILQYPIRLIAAPISIVYFRTATEIHQQGKNLAAFTFKMIAAVLLVSVIPVLVFILVSEELFAFVLGQEWKAAGTLAGILVLQYILMFCSQCTSQCRVSMGKQRANLVVSIIRLCVLVLSGYIAGRVGSTLLETVSIISLGQCLYYIFDMATNFRIMNKKYALKYLVLVAVYTMIILAALILKVKNGCI